MLRVIIGCSSISIINCYFTILKYYTNPKTFSICCGLGGDKELLSQRAENNKDIVIGELKDSVELLSNTEKR
jgi:hypothetical protein